MSLPTVAHAFEAYFCICTPPVTDAMRFTLAGMPVIPVKSIFASASSIVLMAGTSLAILLASATAPLHEIAMSLLLVYTPYAAQSTVPAARLPFLSLTKMRKPLGESTSSNTVKAVRFWSLTTLGLGRLSTSTKPTLKGTHLPVSMGVADSEVHPAPLSVALTSTRPKSDFRFTSSE